MDILWFDDLDVPIIDFKGQESLNGDCFWSLSFIIDYELSPEEWLEIQVSWTLAERQFLGSVLKIKSQKIMTAQGNANYFYTWELGTSLSFLRLSNDFAVYQNVLLQDLWQDNFGLDLSGVFLKKDYILENLLQIGDNNLDFLLAINGLLGVNHAFYEGKPYLFQKTTKLNLDHGTITVADFKQEPYYLNALWSVEYVVQSKSQVNVGSYNFQNPDQDIWQTANDAASCPNYFYEQPLVDVFALRKHAKQMAKNIKAKTLVLKGESSFVDFKVGDVFTYDNSMFMIKNLTYQANNDKGFTKYLNNFEAVKLDKNNFNIVPDFYNWPAVGPQSALVVGDANQNMVIDDLGRIQISFTWDSAETPVWARVAHGLAGGQWGLQHLPRPAQEVLVIMPKGRSDPLVIGSFYNGYNSRPWEDPTTIGLSSSFIDADGGHQIYFDDRNKLLNISSDGNGEINFEENLTQYVNNNYDFTVELGDYTVNLNQGALNIDIANQASVSIKDGVIKLKGRKLKIQAEEKIKFVTDVLDIDAGKINVKADSWHQQIANVRQEGETLKQNFDQLKQDIKEYNSVSQLTKIVADEFIVTGNSSRQNFNELKITIDTYKLIAQQSIKYESKLFKLQTQEAKWQIYNFNLHNIEQFVFNGKSAQIEFKDWETYIYNLQLKTNNCNLQTENFKLNVDQDCRIKAQAKLSMASSLQINLNAPLIKAPNLKKS